VTLLVLFILAVIWAAVLLPPYLQNRSESRPADSISSFQRQLSVLERRAGTAAPSVRRVEGGSPRASRAVGITPGSSLAPVRMSRSMARKRRRDVLFTLAAAATLTFPLAVIMGGPVWALQVLCDLMLAGYVVLLVQVQQRVVERDSKVHYLPAQGRSPEPALLLRRSGS
jgi:Ca2+/Na+ antiporter